MTKELTITPEQTQMLVAASQQAQQAQAQLTLVFSTILAGHGISKEATATKLEGNVLTVEVAETRQAKRRKVRKQGE